MPRTKVQKKKPEKKVQKAPNQIDTFLEHVRSIKNMKLAQIDEQCSSLIENYKLIFSQQLLTTSIKIQNKTVAEMKNDTSSDFFKTTMGLAASHTQTSKSATRQSRNTVKRSASFVDDEGYLTTESSNGTSGGRVSRSMMKSTKPTRVSRSLSRSKMQKPAPTSFKTPSNKAPASYGIVTPKVKPNTPQVLLRRPKQGEMALSLQGSPLLTGGVVAESMANINIPLVDGRLLSIQPRRGLRMSQIPDLDPETKRQLETLRDNLNKVCAYGARR